MASKFIARTATLFGLVFACASCGGAQPQLLVAVQTAADKPDACLPLREPSLSTMSQEDLERIRVPSDHYVWIVGETLEGPSRLSSIAGGSAFVSLTSHVGGATTTRAVATVEDGVVAHTYLGTPLTPAYPNYDGTQLSLTFGARPLDASALATVKSVLAAVPTSGLEYGLIVGALAQPKKDDGKDAFAQTYVLRDPHTCASGACRAVVAEEWLVLVTVDVGRGVTELKKSLCLRDSRLYEAGGAEEHAGSYVVLRVAHARLPQEALGDDLAAALGTLARCDNDFTPEIATRAATALQSAAILRPADREVLRQFIGDTAAATKASTPEQFLEAQGALSGSSRRVCDVTPVSGLVCSWAAAIASCARVRATRALPAEAAFEKARATVDSLGKAATCEARGQAVVALGRDLSALVAAVKDASLEGGCGAGGAGLTCEPFAELSKRSKVAISEAQDALYRECHCAPLMQDKSALPVARLVREAMSCDSSPEEFHLAPAPEEPVDDGMVSAWQTHRQQLLPVYTASQCPACVRLARKVDDELARAVALGHLQARVANVLKLALAPVAELHDRAARLMGGDDGVRCSQKLDEWAVIAQAHQFGVEPRDLFQQNGQIDPTKLEARLKQAELLARSLDGLSCRRAVAVPTTGQPHSETATFP